MSTSTFQKKTMTILDEFLRHDKEELSSVELSDRRILHITRQGGLKALNRLSKMRLLKKRPVLSPDHRPVDKFRLSTDRNDFIELVGRYIHTLMKKD
ncbi:MAG: hypothetical protein QXU18_06115, partial [Thermoplasmatales archaeon]